MYNTMRVEKRNGNLEDVSFDKIQYRLRSLCNNECFDKELKIIALVLILILFWPIAAKAPKIIEAIDKKIIIVCH